MKIITTLLLSFALIGGLFAQDPSQGIVAHWPLDNESANDISGNGYNGNTNGVFADDDRFGNTDGAMTFDGDFSYVEFGNVMDDVFSEIGAQFAISFWIQPGTVQDALENVMGKYAHTGCGENQRQWSVVVSNFGALRFYYASTPDNMNFRSYVALNDSLNNTETWYHCVFNYDGTTDENDGQDRVEIYMNNVNQELALINPPATGELGTNITSGTAPVALMAFVDSNGDQCGDFNYAGIMDDVRIYDRLLTPEDVQILFDNTVGIEDTELSKEFIDIYPNPVTNQQFTISVNETYNDVELAILNLTGQIVQEVSFSSLSNQSTIYLDNLTTGIYFVKIKTDQGFHTRKLVVK